MVFLSMNNSSWWYIYKSSKSHAVCLHDYSPPMLFVCTIMKLFKNYNLLCSWLLLLEFLVDTIDKTNYHFYFNDTNYNSWLLVVNKISLHSEPDSEPHTHRACIQNQHTQTAYTHTHTDCTHTHTLHTHTHTQTASTHK